MPPEDELPTEAPPTPPVQPTSESEAAVQFATSVAPLLKELITLARTQIETEKEIAVRELDNEREELEQHDRRDRRWHQTMWRLALLGVGALLLLIGAGLC